MSKHITFSQKNVARKLMWITEAAIKLNTFVRIQCKDDHGEETRHVASYLAIVVWLHSLGITGWSLTGVVA